MFRREAPVSMVARLASHSISKFSRKVCSLCKSSQSILMLDDSQRPVDIDLAKLKVNLSQPGKVFPATITEVSTGSFTGTLDD